MFFSYLRRELRRRMRQAVLISLGLALGIGLVITVTAASAGVRTAQGTVLHALYGVGTDITVTQSPAAGSGGPPGFRVGGPGSQGKAAKAGTKFTRDTLNSPAMGTLKAATVTKISHLSHVSAAAGGLTVTDTRVSGTIPSSTSSGTAPGRGRAASFHINSVTVDGVDVTARKVGALSSGKITSGRTFRASDAAADVALATSAYAAQHGVNTGSAITVGGAKFTVVGIVSVPGSSSAQVFIPLARAQALSGDKGAVNTIYVAADSAANISAVSKEISAIAPKATVTTSASLANEVTGSLASAASLAGKLGTWLAAAVLAAAFGLAALLTMSAVSRRVREFGTLKALGWRSRRVIGQVKGEALVIGAIGGAAGVVLGFAGARLVSALAPALAASTGLSAGTAAPGGAGQFGPPGGTGAGFRNPASALGSTVAVHLSAPVTLGTVLLAVVLAIAGGLISGSFGGWRAARLRPAAALSRVE